MTRREQEQWETMVADAIAKSPSKRTASERAIVRQAMAESFQHNSPIGAALNDFLNEPTAPAVKPAVEWDCYIRGQWYGTVMAADAAEARLALLTEFALISPGADYSVKRR
jgi:hypothetical protein